ncbi:MAG: YbaK/EbsC family protein [Chloroflexota bacterium]|nr:YbaK/EbsC family protein [Chloroflexota bacterium]MDQ5866280.1 YbaK/EbsC family protein [Chloroflexota bacterium]
MDSLLQLLDKQDLRYTLHSHVPLLTLRDIEEHVTFPIEGMVKTMAFRVKPSTWVLVALGAYSRVDYRKLADALGVKRGALVQASPEEVEAELGFQVGGVAPIPPREGVLAVYDEAVVGLDVVTVGSGRNDVTLEIRMADLLRLVRPIVASIT